jgi:hypothetical protein
MVRDHNYIGAAIGSTLIGISQFYIYKVVQSIEVGTLVWLSFIVAGPMAIVTAMKFHSYVSNLLKSFKKPKELKGVLKSQK